MTTIRSHFGHQTVAGCGSQIDCLAAWIQIHSYDPLPRQTHVDGCSLFSRGPDEGHYQGSDAGDEEGVVVVVAAVSVVAADVA